MSRRGVGPLLVAALVALAFSFAIVAPSSEAQAVKPSPPENVAVTPGDGLLVVSWDAPSGGPAPGTYHVNWGWEQGGVWRYAQINSYDHFTAPGQTTFTIANIPNGSRSFVEVKSGVPASWSPSGPTVPAGRLSEPVRVDDVYPRADGDGAKSSVADLRGMLTGLSTGEVFGFTPAFSAGTTEYRAELPADTPYVEIRPFVAEMNATYRVSPTRQGSDRRVDLKPAGASTVVTIVVTAHDGTTTKTYRLTLQRGTPPDPTPTATPSPSPEATPAPSASLEFYVVEGRMSDGGGGRFAGASSVTISEGLSFYYWIRLDARPESNVVVAPANPSSAIWVNTGSPNPLTFTPENWSRRQSVQVFTYSGAANDQGARSIAHTVTSDDSAFNGLAPSFAMTIVGTNSRCTPPAAPALTANASSVTVSPDQRTPASCGSTPIVGYDTAIQQDDGAWRYVANTRWAVPSAATYSVRPVVHVYGASAGATYKVKLRGITYQNGVTPWSTAAEVTVQATGGL